MTMQTVFGREPTPRVRLLSAIYLTTPLEKERNGPKEGRKSEKKIYI
jgi:hypothetical protein